MSTPADEAALRALVEQLAGQVEELAATSDLHAEGMAALESSLTGLAGAATGDAAVTASAPRPIPGADDPAEAAEPTGEASVLSAVDNGPPVLEVLRPWVVDNISAWCERKVASNGAGSTRWCAHWDLHPEAITRLWALRAQQLTAAAEGASALSAYLRDHFDHHMGVLLRADGPFHSCTIEKHAPSNDPGRRFLPTAPTALHAVAG